jgi:hypothetical protein
VDLRVHRREWPWSFDAPPVVIWPILSDTARFNEAAGLPKHDITETPQDDGSVLFTAVAKQGPFTLAWREEPVNWVANEWFEHRRHFTKGPLKMLCATLEIEPSGPDGKQSDVRYTLEVEASNLLGELVLGTVLLTSTGKTFANLVGSAAEFARGERDVPFDVTPPVFDDAAKQRIARAVEAINATPHAHGLAETLARHATTGPEVDVVNIRPLALAG